ncbi:FecR family protein [Chitinophaga sp. Hz27]|uniref:FecR family protein n=1 Tax=Chitinophaga sp. Hz27 TaxID=3347169 RepID=UPI0035D7A5FE
MRIRAITRAAGNEHLTGAEKDMLWQRIDVGMKQKNKRIYLQYIWKAAAVILLLLLPLFYWLRPSEQPTILRFANNMHNNAPDTLTAVRLILSNNKQVQVAQAKAVISYQSANTVTVNTQQVQQDAHQGGFNTLLVPYAHTAELTLADGTHVWLNAGSRLIYPPAFNKTERSVVLEGEGYFEVSKDADRPFYVYAGDSKVKVLGTSFNISAYKDDQQQQFVLCSGSIAVETGKQAALLKPGQMAVVADGQQIDAGMVPTEMYTAWKDHHLVAMHTTLEEILKKLSRFYNRKITINSTKGSETFSGDIDLHNNMDDVLKSIAEATSMRYENISGNIIFIKP